MPQTVSGHPAIRFQGSPQLRRAYVPGRPVWIRVHRAYAPLFLRLCVLLDQVEQLKPTDTWSYAYRKARMANHTSDHAGYAVDVWSSRQGQVGKRPSAELRDQVDRILDKFTTANGRRIFGWGGAYANTPDAMHFYVNPTITPKDAKDVQDRLGIRADGTVARINA